MPLPRACMMSTCMCFPSKGMKPSAAQFSQCILSVYIYITLASWGQLPAPLIAFYKRIHSCVLLIILSGGEIVLAALRLGEA